MKKKIGNVYSRLCGGNDFTCNLCSKYKEDQRLLKIFVILKSPFIAHGNLTIILRGEGKELYSGGHWQCSYPVTSL